MKNKRNIPADRDSRNKILVYTGKGPFVEVINLFISLLV